MCGANKALRTIVLLCFKLFPVFQSSGKVYIFRITLVYKDSNFLYTLMIQCGCYRILETYIINIFWVYRGIFFSHSGLFIYDPPNLRLTLWHIQSNPSAYSNTKLLHLSIFLNVLDSIAEMNHTPSISHHYLLVTWKLFLLSAAFSVTKCS